jgi:glycosyltransferase involved in cell wall biosynthesis
MNRRKVSIILPALNEEATIGEVIDEIPRQALKELGYSVQILVADSDSRDNTRKIAEEHGAIVINEPQKGKGNAMRKALTAVDGDYVFMLDSDYTYPAAYIPKMLNLLGNYDVVIGTRLRGKREKGAMSQLNYIGNWILSGIASVVYFRRVSDVCTGYWGFRSDVVKSLKLEAVGFELEVELFSQICKRKYTLSEVPIYYRRRSTNPKLSSLKDGLKIGCFLINKRF